MFKNLIQHNITLVSIFIFMVVFSSVQFFKPDFLYNRNGSIRNFGIGYRNKTILPIWLFSILLAILIYICIHYYLTYF
jgi:hypothetical protein